jgi:FkbM family methyltransferase
MFFREFARIVFASTLHRLTTVKYGHRIANSPLGSFVCGKGVVVAKLRCRAQALVFAEDYLGQAMYLWGDENPRITAVVSAVLRAGDTALDIGANFGVVGLAMAQIVGPTGKVHLFEPQPKVAQFLRTSLLMNNFSQAAVHECALSDRTGTARMTVVDPSNLGETTLETGHRYAGPDATQFDVRIEEASDYVSALGLATTALIKIDVEDHEGVILRSLREWLGTARPPVVLFECRHEGRGFQQFESIEILTGLGYELLGYDMKPAWKTRLVPVLDNPNPSGYDFVAVLWSELNEDRYSRLNSMICREPSL